MAHVRPDPAIHEPVLSVAAAGHSFCTRREAEREDVVQISERADRQTAKRERLEKGSS
jgi:hypothetical protein